MMVPAVSERNFTPSSTEPESPPSTTLGVGSLGQMLTAAVLTVMLMAWVTLSPADEETWMTKFDVPTVDGVPVMLPPPGERVSPFGSVPLTTVQRYGGFPPMAVRFAV